MNMYLSFGSLELDQLKFVCGFYFQNVDGLQCR